MFGVNYKGLHKRSNYDNIMNDLQNDQDMIRYPNRDAKQMRNSPYLTQFDTDEYGLMTDAQEQLKKQNAITTAMQSTASGPNAPSITDLRAQHPQPNIVPSLAGTARRVFYGSSNASSIPDASEFDYQTSLGGSQPTFAGSPRDGIIFPPPRTMTMDRPPETGSIILPPPTIVGLATGGPAFMRPIEDRFNFAGSAPIPHFVPTRTLPPRPTHPPPIFSHITSIDEMVQQQQEEQTDDYIGYMNALQNQRSAVTSGLPVPVTSAERAMSSSSSDAGSAVSSGTQEYNMLMSMGTSRGTIQTTADASQRVGAIAEMMGDPEVAFINYDSTYGTHQTLASYVARIKLSELQHQAEIRGLTTVGTNNKNLNKASLMSNILAYDEKNRTGQERGRSSRG